MASVASATTGASAIIENGVIMNQTTPEQKAEQAKQEKATNSANAQKDQFLQLLVAQMKYQDPLEPTSNTEYISQYATFSSLEQMQNMSATLTMGRANEMVGKQVVIHHQESTAGATQEIEGIVDYVTYENNKAKVFVNGSAYSVDEVYAVLGDSYQQASDLAAEFEKQVNELPAIAKITQDDAKKVENLANTYDEMENSAVGKSAKALIKQETVAKLLEYVTQLTEAGMIGSKAKANEAASQTDGTKTDETKVDETKAADGNNAAADETQTDETKAQEQAASASEAEKADDTKSDETGDDTGSTPDPVDEPQDT